MAKVKLGLRGLNPNELVGEASTIKSAMTGNANFPTPNTGLPALGAAITDATAKIAAYDAAAADAQTALSERDGALLTLRNLLTLLAAYVENASGGDKVKIESAAMGVRADASPVGIPDQVLSLVVSAGAFDGTLNANWGTVRGAASYEIEASVDPLTPSSWSFKQTSPRSSASVNSFTSGAKIWLRVRAVGPWSDPAAKTVP